MQRLLLVATLALLLGSCVSSAGRAVKNPGCQVDPRLLGSWRSTRPSQLGTARMSFRFECGCVYRSSVLLWFTRIIREEGSYKVWNGSLIFMRASGVQTRWPYRFEGDHLMLEEYPGEVHRYTRKETAVCD